MLASLSTWNKRLAAWLSTLGPVIDLVLRLEVANAFIRAGLVKIGNWSGTLYLFRSEYHVPLLSPEVAALVGTCGELLFPPLLALGLAARFSAFSLSVVNLVAVVSYWHVLGENEAALATHFYWGLLLLVTMTHGPGKLSMDHFIEMRRSRLTAGVTSA